MKTFIATFGWSETVVTSMIVKHALKSGDKIVLLTPEEFRDERTDLSFSNLRHIIKRQNPQIELEMQGIPITDFNKGVMKILNIIFQSASASSTLIINLSGGMRILVLEAYTATIIATSKYPGKIQIDEIIIEGKNLQIPIPMPPIELMRLNRSEEKILESIKAGAKYVDDLSSQLDLTISTIHKAVKKLENQTLLLTSKEGKRKKLSLTERGHFYLKIKSKDRKNPKF
ncbi:MAG: CRISPR-associated CARF protein Csa3 [Candidatus Njordarchaeia archaeon]